MEVPCLTAHYIDLTDQESAMTEGSVTPTSRRSQIIEALLTLLAAHPIERIGLGDVAKQAGVSLADLRDEFSSVVRDRRSIYEGIDRQVLATDMSDMDEEPVREKLFDILMRRLEALPSAQGGDPLAVAVELPRSAACTGDEQFYGALDELDVDGGRHFHRRTARHRPCTRVGVVVYAGGVHLGGR